MTRHQRLLTAIGVLLVVAACSADTTSKIEGDAADATMVDGSAIGRDGDRGGPDITGSDTGTVPSDVGDGSGDLPTAGGEFLDPCVTDDDCFSGYCLPFDGSFVCTQFCTSDTCPEGWTCRTLVNSGTDAVRLCVPDRDALCSPCETNLDCGGFGDLCVRVGDSGYCARDCEATRECPDGYLCDPAVALDGTTGRQCLPTTGRCSCPPDQFDESRPCVRANEIGICEGVEICEPDLGWSRCSAPLPQDEICDGIDNNCDNLIDEGMPPGPCESIPNPNGSCEGMERCEGEDGWVCDAPTASIEICDGLDNDCNDAIDDGLCFDGNPCTRDQCLPEAEGGGCSHPPFSAPCDDGNVCTTGEICRDGACQGTPLNCDDGNDCTADSCDALEGCRNTNANGTPCQTGDFCTDDACRDGVCTTGPAVSCGTPDICLAPSCDRTVGCTTTRLSGNACDDDDGCTVGDACSNGSCEGGRPY